MPKRIICLTALLSILFLGSTVWAMDFDFDDLFSDDLFVELEEDASAIPPEEALLRQDGLDVGGSYRFSVNASRQLSNKVEPEDDFSVDLGGQLYLDVRPDPDFRVFGKASLYYAADDSGFSVKLQELFSDFNYDNKVFFRAGKQNVKWGVGYFFSPADIISLGRINPLDPDGDVEGPIALKMHYPVGSTNYYLYTLFDGVDAIDKVALAPKMEFVVGGTEVGLGGFLQKDKAPRAMLTMSSSLGKVVLFGEAVVSKGSDIPFLDQDKLFFHATFGGRYSHDDPDGLYNLTGAAQYYFTGEPTSRHLLAAMVGWNNLLNTKLSASAFVNANLTDRSGVAVASLSLPSIGKISPSLGVSTTYGAKRTTTVFASITLGSGSF